MNNIEAFSDVPFEDYSDVSHSDLDVYLPNKKGASSIPDCIDTLPHFPYLPDSAIRGIKLSELYKRLSAAHASSEEIEQIRVRRRRLQKSHFKQKYDRQGREAFEQLKSSLSLLTLQKEQLIQDRAELEEEIRFYEKSLQLEA